MNTETGCALVIFDMAGTTVHDGDLVNDCLRIALSRDDAIVTRDDVNRVMGIAKPLAIRMLLETRERARRRSELIASTLRFNR